MNKIAFLLFFVLSLSVVFAQDLSRENLANFETTINYLKFENDLARVLTDKSNHALFIETKNLALIDDLKLAIKDGLDVSLKTEKKLHNNKFIHLIKEIKINSYEKKEVIKQSRNRYQRTITAQSHNDLRRMFNSYYPYSADHYDVSDNCFNRAHYWSRTLQYQETNDQKDYGTQKVFIFFTTAYQKKFEHEWWYHVAPVVNMKNSDYQYALDSTYIDQPVRVSEWLATFDGHTDGNCKKIENFYEYYSETKPICMYMIAQMYAYTPNDFQYGLPYNWRCSDFSEYGGVKSYPAPGTNTHNRRASWNDREFDYLVPNDCI